MCLKVYRDGLPPAVFGDAVLFKQVSSSQVQLSPTIHTPYPDVNPYFQLRIISGNAFRFFNFPDPGSVRTADPQRHVFLSRQRDPHFPAERPQHGGRHLPCVYHFYSIRFRAEIIFAV